MDNELKRKVSVSPDLANDPNYVAYKAQEEDLKENHMGKWVFFQGGNLIAVEDDRNTVISKAFELTGETGGFVHEIVAQERVIHMRSPRLIRRSS